MKVLLLQSHSNDKSVDVIGWLLAIESTYVSKVNAEKAIKFASTSHCDVQSAEKWTTRNKKSSPWNKKKKMSA